MPLLKPHCGALGVPFMNRTTGAEDTALSIAARVSVDNNRNARDGLEEANCVEGRRGALKACRG